MCAFLRKGTCRLNLGIVFRQQINASGGGSHVVQGSSSINFAAPKAVSHLYLTVVLHGKIKSYVQAFTAALSLLSLISLLRLVNR